MMTKLSAAFHKLFYQETFSERSQRMIPGAIYTGIVGVLYIVAPQGLTVLLYPGMHLSLNWLSLLGSTLQFGLGLALAGVIVGWFTETYEAIVWGGLLITVLLLLVSLLGGGGLSLLGQSVIVIIPLVAACMLVAVVIRAVINHHTRIQQEKDAKVRRSKLVQWVGIVILAGFALGVFSAFSTSSIDSVRALDNTLQNYTTDPLIDSRFPYNEVPGLKSHFGQDYSLYVHSSTLVIETMEVTIHFADGYTVTCLVPKLSSSNEQLLLDSCVEGTRFKSP